MLKHRTKRSQQRDKILEILKATDSHPTAEWLFEQIRQEMPQISRGTVYRNLNILIQSGEVQEVITPDENRHFEARLDTHYHFICRRCDAIYDINDVLPEGILDQVTAKIGHRIEGHSLEFYGLCRNCSEEKAGGS